jgi:hypothetical protein
MNMLNAYKDLRSRQSTWMVAGFVPHMDPEIAKYPKQEGNAASVCNVEIMAQCLDCLFEGWNETYAEPLPMELADEDGSGSESVLEETQTIFSSACAGTSGDFFIQEEGVIWRLIRGTVVGCGSSTVTQHLAC